MCEVQHQMTPACQPTYLTYTYLELASWCKVKTFFSLDKLMLLYIFDHYLANVYAN